MLPRYYNTTGLTGVSLVKSEKKSLTQDQNILKLFKKNPGTSFSATGIRLALINKKDAIIKCTHTSNITTKYLGVIDRTLVSIRSVGRSLNTLKRNGEIKPTGKVKSSQGRNETTYKLNVNSILKIHKFQSSKGILLKGQLSTQFKNLISKRVDVIAVSDTSVELHVNWNGDKGRKVSISRSFTIDISKKDSLTKGTYILDEENSDEDVMYFDLEE